MVVPIRECSEELPADWASLDTSLYPLLFVELG